MNLSMSKKIVSGFWNLMIHGQSSFDFYMPAPVKAPLVVPQKSAMTLYREILEIPSKMASQETWDEEEMLEAHHHVFTASLHLLTLEGANEEKRDTLAWIFAPDMQERLIKGKIVRNHVSEIPFSFYQCARMSGVVDVNKFREEMMNHLDPELKVLLENYLKCH